MLKAFKYRIYPTKKQSILIDKHIGCARFIYNLALETKHMAWIGNRVELGGFELIRQLPDLKKELTWLHEVNSQSLQQSICNLEISFKRFLRGHTNFPKFKKKLPHGSFSAPQNVLIKSEKLLIPKFQEGIKLYLHRPIMGVIRQATISRTGTGKYFTSILCETGDTPIEPKPILKETTVGVDVGIKSFVVTSNGVEIDNPKYLRKAQSRLAFLNSRLSKHGGKRSRRRLAVLHEKVANQRKDFLHKVSSELIKNHDSIAIETLQVKHMLKNHCLAHSISDSSWSMFFEMLEYKAAWYGKNVLKIGTFEPSSKTCSVCGAINKELKLKEREWVCSCGSKLDRDLNAAINIKFFALKNVSGTETKTRNELPTVVGVMTSEARPLLAE